jgi:hypothetical protein
MLRSLELVFQITGAGLQFKQLAVAPLETIEIRFALPELILQFVNIRLHLAAIPLQSSTTACLKLDNADREYRQSEKDQPYQVPIHSHYPKRDSFASYIKIT